MAIAVQVLNRMLDLGRRSMSGYVQQSENQSVAAFGAEGARNSSPKPGRA